jgi:S1-C subfamily serine protease
MKKQLVSAAILGVGIAMSLVQTATARPIKLGQVQKITDRVVFIKTASGQGSGVIIEHVGDRYTILTAAHVLRDRYNVPVEIVTPDLKLHTTTRSTIHAAPNRLDLATITFQSNKNYAVAEIGDSQTVKRGQSIFAAGFLGATLEFNPGTVVAVSHQPQNGGYGLALGTADIFPGMSGGGLFNESGVLIGINGKSVGKVDFNTQNRENRFKPVSGLAVPINTFREIASQLYVNLKYQPTAKSSSVPTADDVFITAEDKSQQGDYRGAISDYDRVLAMNPQFSEVHFRRGIARTLAKDWQGAVADYTKAIAAKPEYVDGYIHRGSIRNILGDWRGAKSDFDFAIALNSSMLSAYVGRGIAMCELNDCKGGLKDYNHVIELNPSHAEAYTNRGLAFARLGDRQKAVSNYLSAAELYRQDGKDREYLRTVKRIEELVRS